jgi:cyclopropane-fatty-acyl-phospholipid synthase
MLTDLCRKTEIEDGDAILDIGCGFGSFAVHALQAFPNSTVDGLTLSKVQADYIRQKQAEPGHPLNTERFKLIEADFNTIELEPVYDRVISIGVFEHLADLGMALEKVSKLVKPGGTSFLHYIVFFQPLERMVNGPLRGGPIIKHIFPGGRIWFEKELYKHQGYLRIEKAWSMNGINYRRTLESWLGNYRRNMKRIRATTSLENHILKLWDLYLRVCIGLFKANRGKFYGNAQYLLKHAGQSKGSRSGVSSPEETKGLKPVYSCPLHWHNTWPEPGSCPFCGETLDLVIPASGRSLTDLNTGAK